MVSGIQDLFDRYSSVYSGCGGIGADSGAQNRQALKQARETELRVVRPGNESSFVVRTVRSRGWFFRKISYLLVRIAPAMKKGQENVLRNSYDNFEKDIVAALSSRAGSQTDLKTSKFNEMIIADIQERKNEMKPLSSYYAKEVLQKVATSVNAAGQGGDLPRQAQQVFIRSSHATSAPGCADLFTNTDMPSPWWTLAKFEHDHPYESDLQPSLKESLHATEKYTQNSFEIKHKVLMENFDGHPLTVENDLPERFMAEHGTRLKYLIAKLVLQESSSELLKNPDRALFLKFYKGLPDRAHELAKTAFQKYQLNCLAEANPDLAVSLALEQEKRENDAVISTSYSHLDFSFLA